MFNPTSAAGESGVTCEIFVTPPDEEEAIPSHGLGAGLFCGAGFAAALLGF